MKRCITLLIVSQVCILPAHAYLDPSVLTYSVQAVAGVVIALGAGAGIYWNKAKKKVAKTLHLEEQEKEREEDLKVFDPKEEETP